MGNFSDLPAEIVVDIFTRLPIESVLDCKLVSKTWRNILHHPSFNQMHSNLLISNLDSTADSGKFSFIFRMDGQLLYYLEYDDGVVSSHGVKKLKLKSPFESYSIVGSCNGLVCIDGLPNHYTMDEFTWASHVAYVVWLLKKKEDESFSWSKEFSLINMDPYTCSLSLTGSGTVLCYSGTKLNLYDLKSCSSKMLEDLGPFDRGIYHAVPLSFVKSIWRRKHENTRSRWQQLKFEEVS